MEKFCYWQEESPIQFQYLINKQRICLLRENEYKLNEELGLNNKKINIFCPFTNAEQATEMDCLLGIKQNE
jgi:hypothetical protein